ncbi:MAG: hypothetical protein WDW36_007704 [Sanguina aurantia]
MNLRSLRGAQQKPSRIVVIPDIHGDLSQALVSLQLAQLIHRCCCSSGSSSGGSGCSSGGVWTPTGDVQLDSETARGQAGQWHWSGGAASLVQLGDVVDRGPDSLPLLALFRRLRTEAGEAGGRVVLLLGNHELMLVQGDFRYVNKGELRGLAQQSGASDRVTAQDPQSSGLAILSQLMGPSGEWGRALRDRTLVARIDAGPGCRLLLVHAGLLPWMISDVWELFGHDSSAGLRPEDYVDLWNSAAAAALAGCSTRDDCPVRKAGLTGLLGLGSRLLGGEGAVWSRAFNELPERVVCAQVMSH